MFFNLHLNILPGKQNANGGTLASADPFGNKKNTTYMEVQKLAFVLLLSILSTFSFGQKNVISLLNDRFYCTFPDSAKNTARETNIMSADPNINNETRVIYDIGDKRIVFFAVELYIKSVDDLERELKKESSKNYPLAVKTIYDKDSVKCIRLTPSKFDEKKNAIFVNSIIIVNADNSLSKMSVYLNPKAYSDKRTFDKITEEVFASFKKGRKRLNLNEHTESFKILDTKTEMPIKLPNNYIVTIDKKYGFEVYKVKKVVTYGDTTQGDLIIYFGFYPSFVNKELQLENYKKPDTDGEFMFQKMKWMNFQDVKRNLFLREQLFVDDDIQQNTKIHIA